MDQRVKIGCRCGAFSAELRGVAPAHVNRLICYCASCQQAVRELGHEDVFEPGSGTDYVQMSAGKLRIEGGADLLACRQFTAKGPLRWHVTCCKTPIGNTLSSAFFPTIALARRAVGVPEDAVGPVIGQFFRRDATERVAKVGLGRGWPPILAKFGKIVIAARMNGEHRKNPFMGSDGRPVARVQRDY